MAQTRTGSGLFDTLRGWVKLPRGSETVEDRVRQVAVQTRERPKPSCCPRCNGPLTSLRAPGPRPDRLGMVHETTFCAECGVEEEWHQLIRAVGR